MKFIGMLQSQLLGDMFSAGNGSDKTLMPTKIDMTLCPLCGQSNNCAMEIEKSTAQKQEPCWCVSVEFPKELLAQLPKDAAGCICNQCVSNAIALRG